ncbi:hypothetical protein VaNZ11_005007 [Volvox africanus]|uniref:Pinin/SDK/MemA protein domain-containing protein n=1 Tax=Volvox africanus TaxID=51714 RepID=A0ABQ5RXN5_9CHLO|nr:hypothetical protein VaNZ11_005007 [Volvox africanus]
MAALDPAALERELEALRRQRYEASQRVRASRQPLTVTASQARNASRELHSGFPRPALGTGRFGSDRSFSGPPPPRAGEGPRAAGSLRDGAFPVRSGSGPSPRGMLGGGGFQNGAPRGRLENGPGGRGHREYDDYGRDRDGAAAGTVSAAAPQPRRRSVLSVVVSDRPAQNDELDDKVKASQLGGDAGRDRDREADRDYGRGRHQGAGDDRDRSWGPGSHEDVERYHGEHGGGRTMKRPLEPSTGAGGVALAEDPDSRKRARRLLGRALLGTLQKFRQEDAQFQASDAAARRAELARKAEEKAAAEAERLRRQAAEERSRKRQEELDTLMDLNLATDIKVLELLFAKKVARRRALAVFLRADGASTGGAGGIGRGPIQPQPVYWMPVSHCPATLELKLRQEKELSQWQETVMAELEQEKDGLRLRAQARRQGIVERRQKVAEERASGRRTEGAAEDRGVEEEEEEDHEALDAVELDAHHEDVEVDEEDLVHGGGETEQGAVPTDADDENGTEAPRDRSTGRAGGASEERAEDGVLGRKADAMETEGAMAAIRDDSDSGAGDDVAA